MTTIILSIINLILLASIASIFAILYYIHRDAIEKVLYPDITQEKLSKSILEKEMQKVREGQKPSFIGLSLTLEQFNELAPYVKDESYLNNTLRSRVPLAD